MNWLMVFIGGGLGSVLRYAISVWLSGLRTDFPAATLISNILASAALAFIAYYYAKYGNMNTSAYLFLAVGFCGGFSTFSTFSLETFELIRKGLWVLAIVNILISVLACLIAIGLLVRAVR